MEEHRVHLSEDFLLKESEADLGFVHRNLLIESVEIDVVLGHGIDEGRDVSVLVYVCSDLGGAHFL